MTRQIIGLYNIVATPVAILVVLALFCHALWGQGGPVAQRVAVPGSLVDIAPSAYSYLQNPENAKPEAWLPLKYLAGIPINQPFSLGDAEKNIAVQKVIGSLLWEEIRPISQLVLTWSKESGNLPEPGAIEIVTLINRGTSSSWWNNLQPRLESIGLVVCDSDDAISYVYDLQAATCGVVIVLNNDKKAVDYSVPKIQTFIPETWKKIDVEIEWGFQKETESNNYSGKLETYDGHVSDLAPLTQDADTKTDSANLAWDSSTSAGDESKRGISFSLLYTGISKWRKEQPYTSQTDDVARTIVTLWTASGNISFLAADLENGPIYAPEYGFFIRRTSEIDHGDANLQSNPLNTTPVSTVKTTPLTGKMNDLIGLDEVKGWNLGESAPRNIPDWLRSTVWDSRDSGTPWFGTNPTETALSTQGITIPAKTAALHPGPATGVGVSWTAPVTGIAKIDATLKHCQTNGSGIKWRLVQFSSRHANESFIETVLSSGETTGSPDIVTNVSPISSSSQAGFPVKQDDSFALIVEPRLTHHSCTVAIDFKVEVDNFTWSLAKDVVPAPQTSNPHGDSYGNNAVWQIFTAQTHALPYPADLQTVAESAPPIQLDSGATSARDYLAQLKQRNLQTTREQVREHEEQTWEDAMRNLHGVDWSPFPEPPVQYEPRMKVHVPSAPLTAQWRLGYWHMVRHCLKHPKTGRLWFNDYPYGILAAETYLILNVLNLYGAHDAAADGFDQWLSLPMKLNVPGGEFTDRPTGLFTEGEGCMTLVTGPEGYGGDMDGVHAFGPGSIGWALVEHYRLTGDKKWLKESATRISANCRWMLRQRQVNEQMVPGGERLWAKGLMPALQVTPDSGGSWMQFYECEAYYCVAIANFAEILADIDPVAATQLRKDAEEYKHDLLQAVNRSIALSPVVPVRDGTFHSVVPYGCYMRGLGTGPWGWLRDGSGGHVGPLYWETVQTAAPLVSPAGILPINDPRVQGWIDVLEDRLMRENPKLKRRIDPENWFMAGWHYQGGLERTANMHLAGDNIPEFLRTWLNLYAINILPESGYIFNEHTTQGPPDKIFEEAAFLERFRNLLVMEEGTRLWIARGTPRAWFAQGEKISVQNAPTHFGDINYEITSNIDEGKISVTMKTPMRKNPDEIVLKIRHPQRKKISTVTVEITHDTQTNEIKQSDDLPMSIIDNDRESIILRNYQGALKIEVTYCQ